MQIRFRDLAHYLATHGIDIKHVAADGLRIVFDAKGSSAERDEMAMWLEVTSYALDEHGHRFVIAGRDKVAREVKLIPLPTTFEIATAEVAA